MKVSVIIPAYNEERFITGCLKSLAEQEEKPDEVIVVDNNSSDRTADIAKQFGVRLIKEGQQGMTPARNAGFDQASYPILIRIDADTMLPPGWIRRIKSDLQNQKVIAVTGPCIAYDKISSQTGKKILQKIHHFLYFQMSKIFFGHNTLFGSNMAIRKSVWQKVRSKICANDKKYHEDMDLASHIAPYGEIMFDPQLIAKISYRRIQSFKSYFDYTIRWFNSIKHGRSLNRSSFDAYTSSLAP